MKENVVVEFTITLLGLIEIHEQYNFALKHFGPFLNKTVDTNTF